MAKVSRITNTLEGRKKRTGFAALMTPKMIISLVLIGIFSFAALVTLSGYAGDLRQQNNGQAHALSRSAIGYGGLVQMIGDMDYDVRMSRTENVLTEDSNVLRIYTLSRPFQADKFDDMDLNSPTLIVMPKWSTLPVEGSAGWVRKGYGDTHVTMTLTTPHCPVAETMPGEIEMRIGAIPGVRDAEVNVTWDPPWDPSKMSDEARLELGML